MTRKGRKGKSLCSPVVSLSLIAGKRVNAPAVRRRGESVQIDAYLGLGSYKVNNRKDSDQGRAGGAYTVSIARRETNLECLITIFQSCG